MLRFQLLEEVHGIEAKGNPVDLPLQKLVRKPKQETTSVVTLYILAIISETSLWIEDLLGCKTSTTCSAIVNSLCGERTLV